MPEPDDTDPTGGDDAFDRRRRRTLWSLPTGLYLLGSRAGDELNLMTINWVSQICMEPKLVGVGVEREALTHRLVADGGRFAVSLLKREDRAVVRKFVRPAEAGEDGTTLNGFPVSFGSTGAPILTQAAGWLDCEVRDRLDLGSHTWFVGEVVGCQPPEEGGELLRMEDTRMNYGG